MLSCYKSPFNLSNNSFNNIRERLAIPLNATLPNAFSYIIIVPLIITINKEDAEFRV